jgi:hypothetical protein
MAIPIETREFVSALGDLAATSVKGATANDLEGSGYG